MKKFFSSLCVFAIICLLAFSGCSDGWTEVQSVTYYTDSVAHTYTSMLYRNIGKEEIQQAEYNNAPEEQKQYSALGFESKIKIDVNRKSFLSTVAKEANQIYFVVNLGPISSLDRYFKYTIINYETRYVKIRFAKKDCLEINYYDKEEYKTLTVKPTSYQITYFEN